QRVRREVSIVKKANHPFIVPFFGAADLGDQLVIVSLFMRNGNLLQYLAHHPSPDRHLLVLQVADAVCYLHAFLGIVHGDLKCENVLVSDDGDALLTDFGLSTVIDKSDSDATTKTCIRQSLTVRFAAPELLKDNARSPSSRHIRSKTPESDVYAFGMLALQV
ncbi:kinase-like protein, partial [Auricularia subglabra TFB-10046 SS5]